MKCTKCSSVAADDAFYCGVCGSELRARCTKCGRPVIPDSKFCVGCGAHLVPAADDDSFLEPVFESSLRLISAGYLGFTLMVMRLLVLTGGVADGWAIEEIAYLLGLCITYGVLMFTPVGAGHGLLSCVLIIYVSYRLLDIFSYELQIVFVDRHKDVAIRDGHLLSADRRVLCLFIHVLDFMGCYAILFLAVTMLKGNAFAAPGLASWIEALYFSVIVASFTGLSAVTPVSDFARLAVISEIILNVVLFSIVFATVVGSLGGLTERKPRPGRASGIFRRRKSSEAYPN